MNGPISLEGHFKVNLTLAKVKSVKVGCKGKAGGTALRQADHFVQQIGAWGAFHFFTELRSCRATDWSNRLEQQIGATDWSLGGFSLFHRAAQL